MPKDRCPETLVFETRYMSEAYVCDRKAGHKGKHREIFYGDDGKRYNAAVKWRRP